MSRPSELQISLALDVLTGLADLSASSTDCRRALRTIRAALEPREVWPAKEAAACLGVQVSNLNPRAVRGLPAPAWVFDRPSTRYPDRQERLYWRDEIEALAERKRAEKEGG